MIEPTTWVLWLGVVLIELIIKGNNWSKRKHKLFLLEQRGRRANAPASTRAEIYKRVTLGHGDDGAKQSRTAKT